MKVPNLKPKLVSEFGQVRFLPTPNFFQDHDDIHKIFPGVLKDCNETMQQQCMVVRKNKREWNKKREIE